MKQFIIIWFAFISLSAVGQSKGLDKYNLSVIDSCLAHIDTSYQVLSIHFVNGEDSEFETLIINRLKSVESIDYHLFKYSHDNGKIFDDLKGMSISIYYESTSCMIQSGSFSIDAETGELMKTITGDDKLLCWTFKKGRLIENCN